MNFELFCRKSKSSNGITIVAPNEFREQQAILAGVEFWPWEAKKQKTVENSLEIIAFGRTGDVGGQQQ